MGADLLGLFVSEECTSTTRELIQSAIGDLKCGRRASVRLEFNRFELTLEGWSGLALLEDVLVPGPEGETVVPIEQLEVALRRSAGLE